MKQTFTMDSFIAAGNVLKINLTLQLVTSGKMFNPHGPVRHLEEDLLWGWDVRMVPTT